MANTYAVIGTQWGDEGKGKVIDILGDKVDYVVRYQGGNNAGHTVVVKDEKFILHLLPSGVLHQNTRCMISAGVVVDVDVLHQEMQQLADKGIDTKHIYVDYRAHLIMPYHIAEDIAREAARGVYQIGTTKRGIGSAYMDKMQRSGLRVADLFFTDTATLAEKVRMILAEKNYFLAHFGAPTFSEADIMDALNRYRQVLADRAIDTVLALNQAMKAGKRLLFEGAQAAMLDIDHGTYPYVTSSSPTAGGIAPGSGIAPSHIHNVIGVAKAYATRVGEGVFATELQDDIGQRLREKGHEFGATTGRPRRTGWLDLVALKYAVMINNLDYLALTKLDVLTGLSEIKVAVGYKIGDTCYETYPPGLNQSTAFEVEYETFPGWDEDITAIRDYDSLPENAQKYVKFISDAVDTPIALISVGPERTQNIYLASLIAEND